MGAMLPDSFPEACLSVLQAHASASDNGAEAWHLYRRRLGDYDGGMILATQSPWLWIAVAGAMYLLVCVRVAIHAKQRGQNPAIWFVLAAMTAGIAPAIGFLVLGAGDSHARDTNVAAEADEDSDGREGRDTQGPVAPATMRCRQCGVRFAPEEIDRTSGAAACPRCHLSLEDEVPQA